MNERLQQAPIGVLEISSNGVIEDANGIAADLLDTERSLLRGTDLREAFPRSAEGTLHDAVAEDGSKDRSFEEYYPTVDRWLEIKACQHGDGVLLYVRDRSRRHTDEQTITRLQRRLDRMETIDSVIVTVLQELTESSDRHEIAQSICEQLGKTAPYEFTWVGEREFGDDQLQVVASAGDAPDLLDQIEDGLDAGTPLPERRAVTSGGTHVAQPLADDESVPRELRLTAFGSGLQSCIAVPIAHRETVYGVMGVYSAREDGFSEQERASLETLGTIAGFAINANRQEDLLFADTVTELAVEIRDESLPFVDVAHSEGCRLSLTGVVPRDDGTVLCYVDAEAPAESLVEATKTHETVENARAVQEDGRTLLEVVIEEETPASVLAAWGATIRAGEYDDRTARIVAETPPDEDVRRVVDTLDAAFAEVDIVSKTQEPRSPETVEAFRNDLDDELTEKQRTVLRTAYLSDYFTSPRGSTAEEVADALGITGPTVLYHLRQAQRKLLDAFFTEDAGRKPSNRS